MKSKTAPNFEPGVPRSSVFQTILGEVRKPNFEPGVPRSSVFQTILGEVVEEGSAKRELELVAS